MSKYQPATQPTLYFIGVTTGKSSIMKVFPAWAEYLGLKDAVIKGIDFKLHDDPEAYREAVEFIRNDPLSMGALVTTHKIDLFHACRDMFDVIDPHALLMDETSCISKKDGKLICHAKDPISSGLAIDGFLGADYFERTSSDLFSMGAGGSTIAITWHLMRKSRGENVPARIIVSNRSQHRLDEIKRIHAEVASDVAVEYILAPRPEDNDAVLNSLKPGSFIINATGLGKDAPGSPLSNAAVFPEKSMAWDLNYRGNLVFLDQARAQEQAKSLNVVDGWTYFIHGWTQVIAEVFHIDIPTSGPDFDRISEIAIEAAGR
ncbi:shikimate dehydrogenase [Brucella pituitosa]|uniref:shikimate dehydrogenase family protein n=1 Tax=Brucella TaxID=234 RepID=UPI0004635A24|nr:MULTISPECIES: shikimate dehydrogenase [Brucella]PQZ50154.1 shikimate dehydrogenase [Ochrobactrum sp. MYb19]PRA55121.1 shikimate dehydrogenase [Ochrobactrum sp. MYb68]PRA68196.1 shikimate dehydrogenase [Ochrobactrum sp. MYb18]PRA74577.1 shikimate dehydrogenase [Brucella thiophenivorans]PRA84513.1 shikimate dehydrogenase [Ochrobactrum sp. MYb29]PRA90446.1 shikimate dehydrogenase [Ochrobactrum sp. MYb14]PRA95897.1 shikimate dehydrogenase [Ochrobactrum sp. MYb15]